MYQQDADLNQSQYSLWHRLVCSHYYYYFIWNIPSQPKFILNKKWSIVFNYIASGIYSFLLTLSIHTVNLFCIRIYKLMFITWTSFTIIAQGINPKEEVLSTKASAHLLYVHRSNPGTLSPMLGRYAVFHLSQQASIGMYLLLMEKNTLTNPAAYWHIGLHISKYSQVREDFSKGTYVPLCAVKANMQIKYTFFKKLEAYCAYGSNFKVKARHSEA